MKLLTLVLGCLFGIPLLQAVEYTSHGVRIEISALTGSEYVVDVYGCRITAAQCIKKGYQPLQVRMSHEGTESITIVPYISGANPLTTTELVAPFLYAPAGRALLQLSVGSGLLVLGAAIERVRLGFYGFKRLFVQLTLRHKVKSHSQIFSNKNVLLDMASLLKQWGKFLTVGVFGIGQYPPHFTTWFQNFKSSKVSRYMQWGGLLLVVTAPITGLCVSAFNSKRITLMPDLNLAAQYRLVPGQSMQKMVVVRMQEEGVFGCEMFKPDAEDPCAAFSVPLQVVQKEIIEENESK